VFAVTYDVANNPITFRDLLHNLNLDVGERSEEIVKEGFMIDPQCINTAIFCTRHRMVNTILRPEIFQRCKISTIPNDLNKVLDYLLIFIKVGH
jgi:hypothetical protein